MVNSGESFRKNSVDDIYLTNKGFTNELGHRQEIRSGRSTFRKPILDGCDNFGNVRIQFHLIILLKLQNIVMSLKFSISTQ